MFFTYDYCANGPKLVLKDLCKKSFVRNVRLPTLKLIFIVTCTIEELRTLSFDLKSIFI